MSEEAKTGLFFGSFNPIHNGHLMIASYMVEYAGLDQVWFVVSPQNPLKEKSSLLADHHRLSMVNLAVEDDIRFKSSNIEFKLPKPSYTIDTLAYLSEKYPGRQFIPILGSDNLPTLHKWKNCEALLSQYKILIYPRPGTSPSPYDNHPSLSWVDAPLITVSSTFIRKGIREGRDMRYFLPEKVWRYIEEMHFYHRH